MLKKIFLGGGQECGTEFRGMIPGIPAFRECFFFPWNFRTLVLIDSDSKQCNTHSISDVKHLTMPLQSIGQFIIPLMLIFSYSSHSVVKIPLSYHTRIEGLSLI